MGSCHHPNPIGDRSGACRLAEPVSVALGPAATLLNLTTLALIVMRGMAAPGNSSICDVIPNGPHSSRDAHPACASADGKGCDSPRADRHPSGRTCND